MKKIFIFALPILLLLLVLCFAFCQPFGEGLMSQSKSVTVLPMGIYVKYVGSSNYPVPPTAIVARELSGSELKAAFDEVSSFSKQFVVPSGDLEKLFGKIKKKLPTRNVILKFGPVQKFQVTLSNGDDQIMRFLSDESMKPVFSELKKYSFIKNKKLYKWLLLLEEY